MKHTVRMILEKQTPGAVRYQEIGEGGKPLKGDADGALIVNIYLRKAKLDSVPQGITVTVED